ncbi:MAG: sporulation protein YqfD [Christensenellaceae bacterium]|nr:sporulation protein YqfD [Christensenellaceae bacterium]
MHLWKFTRGYVKIRLYCDRPERMVNLLLAEGICLHSIGRMSLHELTAIVRLKFFMQLCEIVGAHGGDVSLIEEHGLPVYLKLLKSRPMLAITLIIGFISILFASRRIFIINAVGCDGVSEEKVLNVLYEHGVSVGVGQAELEIKDLSKAVLDSDDRIGFADVRVNGVVLTAVIREVNSIVLPEGDDAPSSIYADKDCVIVSIVAEDGNAVVKNGQAVKRGQTLVSGDITPEGAETPVKVRSKATIFGQVAYRFSVEIKPTAARLVRSGNSCDYTKIMAFGIGVGSDTPYDQFEVEVTKARWFDACGLPISVCSGQAYELVSGEATLDERTMRETALAEADALIRDTVSTDARIIMKTTDFVWQDDGSLLAVVRIQTIEKIGYSRYI